MSWDSRSGLYDFRIELWLPTDLPDPIHGYAKPPRERL
jgi:hypothetical protein